MPKIFSSTDIFHAEKEIQRDYFDRHAPVIECNDTATEGEKFCVRVRVGTDYKHPDDGDHFIGTIQLWNREELLAEARIMPGALGKKPNQAEVCFYIVPIASMNLLAMSYCTKHGLWQSQPKEVKVLHPQIDNK